MEAQSGANAEIEWQLDAPDLRPVLRWIESAAASDDADGITITSGPSDNHVDTYLDTEDRRLDRAGYSVRVRRSRRLPAEATMKTLDGARPDALRIRGELAEQLELDEPTAIAHAPGPVGERVRALVGRRKLVPLFELRTRRRVFPLAAMGTPSGELLLDDTTIREPGGRILGSLRRVEVEVPESAVGAVGLLVEDLQKACGLQPAVLSKYEAALAASGGHRTEPESFGRTAIEPGDTLGQVGLAILRRQFATLLAKEPGTRLADNIEELHNMRVASRRLRAALALFRDVLPTEAVRLRPELAWIGQTIGAVRDLDVQLVQIEKWTAVLPEPDREALARLRALLTEERGRARAEMLQAFDSPRYERFVRRFGATLRSSSGTRGGAARALAPDLIERRHRRLRKAMSGIGSQAEPADYHRLRIAAKRFRYALEFLSDVYPGDTRRLVRRMVALQDLLGAYQDAHVATTRLRDLVSRRAADLGPNTVFAMGAIAELYRSRMGEIRPEVARTYARVTGNAWKRLRRRMEAASPSHPSQ